MTAVLDRATCPGCGSELAAGLLACPSCHRLTHGATLTKLAAEARQAEANGDLTLALGTWRRALELLPGGTSQVAPSTAR